MSDIGTRISHYEVLEKLGGGGMGVVYKARDSKLNRLVALKFLPPEVSRDEEANARFTREAQMASALNHPNICTIHEIDETEDGRLFIAMSLYEGQTLKGMLRNAPLEIDLALDLAGQIASGLAAAHEKGIVHRDIKPANIFVDEKGRAVILDFGLAKLAGAAALTMTGSTLGTISYMSPEQAQATEVDHRTDIWALGALLHEMLSGQKPFPGDYDQAVVYNILNTEPEPLTRLNPDLPVEIEAIVLKALQKDREQRHSTVEEFLADLYAIDGKQVAGTVIGRRSSKRRRVQAYLGIALVAIIAVSALLSRGLGGSDSIDSIAVLPLINMSGDPDQEYFADGMTEVLIGALAKMSALKVIARQSVMQYKGSTKPISEIAAELGVDAIVEGSVYREGNMVRVRASLILAATDQSLWSEEFDHEFRNVLALHSEVARAIAAEIEVAVTPDEAALLADTAPVDPDAYEAYLKGRFHWYRFTPADMARATEYFLLAIEEDSTYAAAYVGYSDAIATPAHLGLIPTKEIYPVAKAATQKALVLDDNSEEAHDVFARISWAWDWDWEKPEAHFKRAIELNPNYPDARAVYSQYLSFLGRHEEALSQAQTAEEIDPLNSWFHLEHAQRLAEQGRYDEAITIFKQVAENDPELPVVYMYMWHTLYASGHWAEAADAGSKRYAAFGDSEIATVLVDAKDEVGYRDVTRRAAEILEARAENSHVSAKWIAELWAHAGDDDRAIDWLEKAVDNRETALVYAFIGPEFASAREDPRFETIRTRMKDRRPD